MWWNKLYHFFYSRRNEDYIRIWPHKKQMDTKDNNNAPVVVNLYAGSMPIIILHYPDKKADG